jgi:putative endonuclease
MYFVYILYSITKNKYYVGSTSDLDERIKKHNTDHRGFTGGALDWVIKFVEEYPDRPGALKREKQIKAWKS